MNARPRARMSACRLAPLLVASFLVSSCSQPMPLVADSPSSQLKGAGHAWGYWRKQELTNMHLEFTAPGEGWDTASILLISPDPLVAPNRLTLAKGSDLVAREDGSYKLTNLFDARFPMDDGYTLVVSLWQGGEGNVLAGQAVQSLSLILGPTTVPMAIAALPPLACFGTDPASASVGDVVSLSGQGFSVLQEQNGVTLGEVPAQVIEASADMLRVVVPEVPAGTHTWKVRVGQLLTGRANFIVE